MHPASKSNNLFSPPPPRPLTAANNLRGNLGLRLSLEETRQKLKAFKANILGFPPLSPPVHPPHAAMHGANAQQSASLG